MCYTLLMRARSQSGAIPLMVEEGESAPPEELTALTQAWLGHEEVRRRLALVPLWMDQDDPGLLTQLEHLITPHQRIEFQWLGAAAYYLSRLHAPELRWRRPTYQSLKPFSGLSLLHLPEDDGFQGERGLLLLQEHAGLSLTQTTLQGDWVASTRRMARVYLDNLR